MRGVWNRFSMGKGWEWALIPLAILSAIVFGLMENWFALVWALFAGSFVGSLWKMRLAKEKLEEEAKNK